MTVIHALWRDIPQEFDDYISHPKPNGYQSLHTAVIGPFGRAVEVQIRTERMHEHAERGVAAHWRYKEGGKGDPNLERQIDWIREILEHKDASLSSEDLVDLFKAELTHERIYVITPKGDVMDLPKSATPLDFAYYIHTDIGHRCRGARVNGRIMPLTTELQSGDRIEVLTAKQAIPSRDWLQLHLGYLNTSRARSKARLWFREQNKQAATQAGKEAIEQSFKRLSLPFKEVDWNQLAVNFNYSNSDGLFAAFANDEVSFNRLLNKVPKSITQSLAQEQQESHFESVLKIRPTQANTGEPVNIQGVGNLMVQMAQCCNPVPPDPIIGFITLSRGISIHKQDCSNLLNMESFHKERFINISWHTDREQQYAVNIRIIAISRSKLFYDISSLLSAEGVDIVSFNTAKDAADQTGMTIDMQVQVKDLLELNRLIEKLNQLSGILSVYRSHEKRP
jgi:GTP pyrophosphokinase